MYMKTRSSLVSTLLNILVIIFMMNGTLAHSTCTMGNGASAPEMLEQVEDATQAAMPCHTSEHSEASSATSSDISEPNQCCADCSVLSLPMSTGKAIVTAPPTPATIAPTLTLSRSIELPFRPPIANLL
ncbi:MAG: hypothetical protein P8Q91_09760 [Porticoccaceae bacterium]|nr:hypothetical protein [Porticoccaceae bacterium]